MRHPNTTVPIEFVRQLINVPQGHQQRIRAELVAAGIAPELLASDHARVTAEQFSNLYKRVVVATGDESPGMFSRQLKPGSLKFLCCGVVASADLLDALKTFCQFFTLVLDDLQFKLRIEADMVSVVLIPAKASLAQRRFTQEVMVKLVHGILSWLAARKMPIARLDLAYPPPAHASDYVFLFPGPAHFDQAVTAIHFDRHLIEAPVRQRWDSIRDFLVHAPADWMFVSFADRLVSHKVRDLLGARLGVAWRIERVAEMLLMSTRTLARRLSEEGTSFQQIKDEVRRDAAVEMLTRSNMTPELVASKTGFDDLPTFYRAFKRWTGCSPGAYRRGLDEAGGSSS